MLKKLSTRTTPKLTNSRLNAAERSRQRHLAAGSFGRRPNLTLTGPMAVEDARVGDEINFKGTGIVTSGGTKGQKLETVVSVHRFRVSR
jgi:hypothetical protein